MKIHGHFTSAEAYTKRYTQYSVVQENMIDYYDHDERERKQMHHSSGVRIYRSGPDEEENNGAGGLADEEDKDNEIIMTKAKF